MTSTLSESGALTAVETEVARIRPLRTGDRERILWIVRDTGMFSDEEAAIALELVDVVLTKPGQEDYIIFVHESAGLVDGYYCVGPTPGTSGTFDLYWIVVARDSQGKGIGRILNSHAEEFILARNGRLLIAETSSREDYGNTRSFYLKQGYAEVARISDYYRVGDDLIVYGKYLTRKSKGG